MQIIGNQPAREFLAKSALQGQIAPSYLFVGPRGSGKALTARWFAQSVFCSSPAGRPCGICSACRRMESGNYPDFKYAERLVRSGPNEGIVDQVRSIISDLQTSPYEANFRFFVFNEAGALNEQSQNALLKTVEEPPPHLVLILVTESLGKMLPTILSRCCVVRFNAVERGELAAALQERGCDTQRSEVLAAISGGAPGKALQMLEDEASWAFRLEVLQALSQLPGGDMWCALETARQLEELAPNKSSAKTAGESSLSFQPDLAGLLDIAILYYRDAMLVAAGADRSLVANCDYAEELYALAQNRGALGLEKDLQRLQEAYEHLNSNVQPRLWLQHLCLGLAE
ncbi:MAG: DNA polymerase III subunit delta' [bacterium]|nr:DNA polymerase III subunit delta' [bacterium]